MMKEQLPNHLSRPTEQEILAALVRLTHCMADEDILKLRIDTVAAKFGADEIILRCFATSKMGGTA